MSLDFPHPCKKPDAVASMACNLSGKQGQVAPEAYRPVRLPQSAPSLVRALASETNMKNSRGQ